MKWFFSLFTVMTVAVSVLLTYAEGSIVQAAENTAIYTDFETGAAESWNGKDGADISIETEGAYAGNYCLKVSGRNNTWEGAKLGVTGLEKNRVLEVSAYARYETGPDTKIIQFTLAAGGNAYIVAGKSLSKGEWGQVVGKIVLPEGIDYTNASIFVETPWKPNPVAEEDFMDIYMDNVKISVKELSDISGYPSLKELYQDVFYVGVAAPNHVLTTGAYNRLIKQQFNSLTMENEMKPAYVMDENTSRNNLEKYKEKVALNFEAFKTGMNFAKANGIQMRGHTLVWHSQTPEWFFYENYDTSGTLAGRELMLKRMENYIKDVIAWTETNYPGVIYAWDVVNEAVADPWGLGLEPNEPSPLRQEGSLWYQTIGDDFVEKAFEYARKYTKEYAPDYTIKLFYNDYNEYFSQKRDGIIKMLKPIKEAGNLDGVGMQSHIEVGWDLDSDGGYMAAAKKFSKELDVEVHITELDIGMRKEDTEETQGKYYEDFMRALLEAKENGANVTSVTFWGLTDELSWRSEGNCLLFRGDLSKKPSFESLVKVANAYDAEREEEKKEEENKEENKEPVTPPIVNEEVLNEGEVYTVGNYRYKITNLANKTASVVSTIKSNTRLHIGNVVTIENTVFAITAIEKNAFKNSKKLTTVNLGKNITSIGANAFKGCKKLKVVKIKSSKVKTVGKQAFKGTAKKMKLDVPNKKRKAYKKIFTKKVMAANTVMK